MKKNDILILGGSGLIGSNLTEGIKLSSKDINLLDYNSTINCFNKFKPKVVIQSACKKLSSQLLYTNPADYFNDNVIMNLNVFKASVETEIEQLIVMSSITAFLNGEGSLNSDIQNHRVKNILSDIYKQQYNLNSKVFCLSNVFGPNSNDVNGFIPFIIKKCYLSKLNNKNIELKGNKYYKRDFIFVKDVVNLIEMYYNGNINLDLNPIKFYSGKSYTLEEIVNFVVDIMDFEGDVIWSGNYDNVKDKDFIDEDEPINFKFTPVYDGIKETINWYNSHKGEA